MCLDAKDAELNRPKLKQAANTVIEVEKDVVIKDESIKSKDVYSELIKLDDLRKKGIINDADFEAQKKKLLNGN